MTQLAVVKFSNQSLNIGTIEEDDFSTWILLFQIRQECDMSSRGRESILKLYDASDYPRFKDVVSMNKEHHQKVWMLYFLIQNLLDVSQEEPSNWFRQLETSYINIDSFMDQIQIKRLIKL